MKRYLIAAFCLAVAVTTSQGQTYTTGADSRVPREKRVPQRPPAPYYPGEVTGVIPRAFQGGNPLQMFNPKAPRRYGTAEEAVTYDPYNPGKWKGIKFFEFRF